MNNTTCPYYYKNRLYTNKTLQNEIFTTIELSEYLSNCKINNLSQFIILKYQKLDIDFCINYIMNDTYSTLDNDYNIPLHTILKFQPHIKEKDLLYAIENKSS